MNLSAKVVVLKEPIDDGYEIHPHTELFGELKVDTSNLDLMLRTAPDYDSEVIASMPKGSIVQCYGFTDASLKWALVEYTTEDGKKVAGFAHLDYLIKIKK